MGNNLLHNFLDIGMLNIAEDDEKFEHLQKASLEVAKKLPKKRVEIISYTLVALDPNVSPDSQPLVEAEGALKKQWSTFRNRFPDTPRQMLRPIILEALRHIGESDPISASIIWLTGGSYLPYADLGREKEIYLDFLSKMGNLAEKQAVEEWASSSEYQPPSFPTLNIELPDITQAEVDAAELTAHLAAAAGPTNAQNQPSGTNPNQHWPSNNGTWLTPFAKRAGSGIAEVINSSISSIPFSSIKERLDQELTDYASALNNAVGEAVNQVIQGAVVSERRTKLLWWKETLYSPTLKLGYRSIDPIPAALVMAYDLYAQVPMYCPQSVDYFLREAVREATVSGMSSSSSKLNLVKLVEQLVLDPYVQPLKPHLGFLSNIPGRKPLLGFIQSALARDPAGEKELSNQVGVAPETELSLEDFAAWIFRDLQAQRLATVKS